ncbi:MAG TPA: Asp-tRNA(Asn)/Glu-tRNA(Gln) amidotransferase subunit GatB [Candidatus Paceibacterota bacterium]|nr:Asp-tRNA(Asn)/Glu-tRNA(Gln) amidotransferase subunit GatB [Candidatus Paceibacterota bacterium]
MASYRPTIGLEIHAELATQSKMFCGCTNNPEEERANANTCPVCMAHPGTLPVPNREAIRHVLRVGAAVGGDLADFSEFDRKSYFYPDIPKGYQISQFEHPLVTGGMLADVAITRIHLEEDTARSSHAAIADVSLVDFNRAGVPLMELVTEPVIHDAETAGNFARELQLLLRTLGASHANLEKGEMRIEANISVSKDNTFGTKVEVKNLNSFRSVERAIAFEVDRQISLLEAGEEVRQETRGWDENAQKTFSQRLKEGSADYRYFPEPDIPKLLLSEISDLTRESIAASLPELPWDRRRRYAALGLKEESVLSLTTSPERSAFFDQLLSHLDANTEHITIAANYLLSDVAGWYAKNTKEEYEGLDPSEFAVLVKLVANGDLSSRGAKDTLGLLLAEGGRAEEIARRESLMQISDEGQLLDLVKQVLAANPSVADEYRSGKEASLQFLLGMAIKETRGAGNPQVLRKLLLEELGS